MKKAIIIVIFILIIGLASAVSYLTFINLNLGNDIYYVELKNKTINLKSENTVNDYSLKSSELAKLKKDNEFKIGEYSKWKKRSDQIKQDLN